MNLETLLERKRETILGEWYDLIIKTYSPVTSEFLTKQRDQFRNPLGHAITESIGRIYDEVRSAMDTDRLLSALDGVIRIRSVQDFTPSEAVAFVFDLKAVMRQAIEAECQGQAAMNESIEIDSRIDRVALLAFEKYMACRESLHEIRNNEIKRRMAKLLQRADAETGESAEKRGNVCGEA